MQAAAHHSTAASEDIREIMVHHKVWLSREAAPDNPHASVHDGGVLNAEHLRSHQAVWFMVMLHSFFW